MFVWMNNVDRGCKNWFCYVYVIRVNKLKCDCEKYEILGFF